LKADEPASTGLPTNCQALCGIHHTNASLLRHLDRGADAPRTVLSTGTWVIAAALGVPLAYLRDHDMLANTNALGQPVACMRFMGGREFAVRPQQAVSYSDDASGTTYGAWLVRYRAGAASGLPELA
jgi:sugar (pentulose or hexulose) kinase